MNHDDPNPHDLPELPDPQPDPSSSPEPASPATQSSSTPAGAFDSGAPAEQQAIQNDLQVPWTWADIASFILYGMIGSVIIAVLLGQVAVSVFGVSRSEIAASEPNATKAVLSIAIQTVLSGLVLLYLFFILRARSPAPFWLAIGWRHLHREGGLGATAARYIGAGAGLAIVTSLAGRLVAQPEELPIEQLFRSRPAVLLLMAFGILIAPVVEETIFRGFLYPVVARQFGMRAGVILTGLVFGGVHAAQLWGGWGQIALVMVVGIVLTWVRARTGSVTASYLMHLGYNSLSFLGFFVATGGLRHFPGAE